MQTRPIDAELPERLRGCVLALCGAVACLGLMMLAVWMALDDLGAAVETSRAATPRLQPVVVYITPKDVTEAS